MTWLSNEIYHDFKLSMSSLVDIFNQQLVPAIQKWVILTKDYVLDLFWRYIAYSIITDSLVILGSIILLSLFIYFLKKIKKYDDWLSEYNNNRYMATFFYSFIVWWIVIVFLCCWIEAIRHIIQSIYLPEITIYEKIVELKS